MINPKFNIEVKGGSIIFPSFNERARLVRRLLALLSKNDGLYTIEGKKATNKRTNPQNAYYWGVVIPLITQEFKRLGNVCNEDLVHEYLKGKFGLTAIVSFQERGEKVVLSTSKYSKQDFINYLDLVILFATQTLEVQIPEPSQAKTQMIY